MLYHSSRNRDLKANSREAIVKGLASDGGLFVSHDALTTSLMDPALLTETYQETAQRVFGHFLNDFTPEEIAKAVNSAYDVKFADARIAPLSRVGHEYLLELYHGPTSAFKDMALSILPWFMSFALESMGKKVMIVTATSGDTGKAALEAFQDVPNVGIAVLYPHRKVSEIQRLQMATQRGDNVAVFA